MLRACALALLLAQATAFSATLSTTQMADIQPFGNGDVELGTVSVTVSDAELTLLANLVHLPANASGGVHIHYGYSCESEETVKGDAPTGANKGHYYVPTDPQVVVPEEDPWGGSFFSDGRANAVWETPPGSTEAEKLTVEILAYELNVNPKTALARVVIVHAPSGAKIGCGVLK